MATESSVLSSLNSSGFIELEAELFQSQTSQLSQRSNSTTSTPSIRRPRTSWVWDHTTSRDRTTIYIYNKKSHWQCGYCEKRYAESGGTTVMATHLKKAHGLFDTQTELKAVNQQRSILTCLVRGKENDYKRRRDTDFDRATFEQLLVRWVCRCSISLSVVEQNEFRALLAFLNDSTINCLPKSHNTLREWIVRTFEYEKQRIMQALQSAYSKVHFTVDLWTSPNAKALMGIVAHYIAENGALRQSVLSLRELEGQHTGANQAGLIFSVLEEYGILSKVGYFMMDNASNNDTMIEQLSTCK